MVSRLIRRRMSVKSISIGLASAGRPAFAGGPPPRPPAPPGPPERGGSSLKSSLNWSSANFGVFNVRSTRTIEVSSVRWLLLNTMNVPSGLHDSALVFAFGIALTARLSPPAAGTRYALRNERVLRPRYATHSLSADHCRLRGDGLM